MSKEEPKKPHKVISLGDNRYKSQRGNFVATFEIDDNGRITFFDGLRSDAVKRYGFAQSEVATVKAIAGLLNDAAILAKKLNKERSTSVEG